MNKLFLAVPECAGFSFEKPHLVIGKDLDDVKDILTKKYGTKQEWIDYIEEEDLSFQTMLEIFEGDEQILINYISDTGKEVRNYNYFADFYSYLFRNMHKGGCGYANLEAWEYKEIDTTNRIQGGKIYLAHSDKYDDIDDVRVVFAHDENEALMVYAKQEAKTELFREYILDRAGFADSFWKDHGGYLFSFDYETEREVPRDDIMVRFKCNDDEINRYIFSTFEDNIHKFFEHESHLADAFLNYYHRKTEELPESIYGYIAYFGRESWSGVEIHKGRVINGKEII